MIDYDSDMSILTNTVMDNGVVTCALPDGTIARGEVGLEWGFSAKQAWVDAVRQAAKEMQDSERRRTRPKRDSDRDRTDEPAAMGAASIGTGDSPEDVVRKQYAQSLETWRDCERQALAAAAKAKDARVVLDKWAATCKALGVEVSE